MASYYFYPACQKLEIGCFSTIFQKPEVIQGNTLGVKCHVPLALSNGIWIRAMGLPVLAGLREVCLSLCPPLVLPTSTGHSFRAIAMKLCRHITLGGIQSPSKNFGGRTPLGEIFSPNFFSRYRSENLPESCPRPRKK